MEKIKQEHIEMAKLKIAKEDALELLKLLLAKDRAGLYEILEKIKFLLLSVEVAEEQKKTEKVH